MKHERSLRARVARNGQRGRRVCTRWEAPPSCNALRVARIRKGRRSCTCNASAHHGHVANDIALCVWTGSDVLSALASRNERAGAACFLSGKGRQRKCSTQREYVIERPERPNVHRPAPTFAVNVDRRREGQACFSRQIGGVGRAPWQAEQACPAVRYNK